MRFFLVLALFSKTFLCQATKYNGPLITDDWKLQNASETFQGPVRDDRYLDFEIIRNKSIILHPKSSMSFSLYPSYDIVFSVVSLKNQIYSQYSREKSDRGNCIFYTILIRDNVMCLFEDDMFLTTLPVFSLSHIVVTAKYETNWRIYDYLLRTSNHISKEPTTIRLPSKSSLLYVYTCSHCYLEVELPENAQKYNLTSKKSGYLQLWKPATLFIQGETNITLRRKTTNGRYDGYWGFDLRSSKAVNKEIFSKDSNAEGNKICNCGIFANSEDACGNSCHTAARVEFTHVEFTNFTLTFYWNTSTNCQTNRFVVGFQKKLYKTDRFVFVMRNLDGCTNYTVYVAPINGFRIGKEANMTVFTQMNIFRELFDLQKRKILFDATGEVYKKILPCITPNHKPWSNQGTISNEASIELPFHANTQKMKFTVKSLSSGPFDLVDLSLGQTNIKAKFKINDTNLIILPHVDGINLTLPSDYGFEILKNGNVYFLRFPAPFEITNQNDLYQIIVKLDPLKCCHNETFPEVATIVHEFIYKVALKRFRVCYCGERNGSSVRGCIDTNQTSTDVPLRPLRRYSISVAAVTNYFTSPSVSLPLFESNSGVPVLTENFTPPTTNGTRANFTFSKLKFSDGDGKIVAYGLFLLTGDVERMTDYGFWNGSKETWPLPPENSTQLTPVFWNPFENASSVSFIIDSPPLEINKNYLLIVRALTDRSYKDSPSLHFKTELLQPDVTRSTSNILYFTCVLIVCFFLLLIFVGYKLYPYLKKRRNRRSATTDETHYESTFLLCELDMFKAIEVAQFDQFLTDEFSYRIKREFDTFEVRKTQPLTVALQALNINKNRRREEYLPYDCNRVVLKKLPGVGTGNYINANYIDGYNRTKAYIAAQGPKFSTLKNFWRMIWQENVEVIVMASNTFENKERMCAEYWPPKENAIFECGKMIIRSISQSIYDCYIRRKLEISYNDTTKVIIHFQIKGHEKLYPNYFLSIIKFLRETEIFSPILVHSGYGVGRTGVLILCDLALQMIKDKGKVDFYNLTQTLKQQRLFMVKDLEHYALAHFTVKEYIMDQSNPFNEKNDMKEQLEYLEILCNHDIILQKLTTEKENPLSVVSVLRYGDGGKFLVSQDPTTEDFARFWVTVADESIEYVVFLNKKIPFQTDLFQGDKEVIQLKLLKTSQANFCTVKKFSLLIYDAISKEIIYEKNVYVLEFDEWKPRKSLPRSIENFVELVVAVNKLHPPKPTLILCSDGCTASGLFVALSYVLGQYKSELEIDVCTAVRVARRSGKKFVHTEKQLKFIYECVKEFCKNNESYQNIDCL